jgi:hypothetical protein
VRQVLGADSQTAREILRRLRHQGFLRQEGRRGGATYRLVGELRPPAGLRLGPEELASLVVGLAESGPIQNADVRRAPGLTAWRALRSSTAWWPGGDWSAAASAEAPAIAFPDARWVGRPRDGARRPLAGTRLCPGVPWGWEPKWEHERTARDRAGEDVLEVTAGDRESPALPPVSSRTRMTTDGRAMTRTWVRRL